MRVLIAAILKIARALTTILCERKKARLKLLQTAAKDANAKPPKRKSFVTFTGSVTDVENTAMVTTASPNAIILEETFSDVVEDIFQS
jgi:hypothetical protein